MADRTQQTTHGVLGDVKSGLKGAKGAGDAIRGSFNESVDTAFHEPQGEAANRSIKEKGIREMEGTDQHFKGPHHTTGPNTAAGRTGVATGGHTGVATGGVAGSSAPVDGGAGAHSGSVGN